MHAVRGIDLEIEQGEIVAFLGPNGAGKTTTIDMVLGLSRPTTGSVEVLGLPPAAGDRPRAGLRGDADRRPAQGPHASARPSPTPPACSPTPQPVDEVLAHAGISGIADRKVGKCSGGEQQRLRFAMALLSDPALLLLDEPTTGMDVEGRRAFWSAIRADAEKGRTVLFATHYLEEADQYADRIVLISQGRIVADGTGRQIKALAAGRTVRATLARPRPPARWRGSPASRASRSAATPCCCTPRTPTRSPATCSPRPTPTTWRSPPGASRTRSSASPATPTPTPDRDRGGGPMTTTDRRPDHPPGAAARRLQPDRCCGIELRRMLRNRRTIDLHAGVPGRAVLRVRRPAGLERRRRLGQRGGVHHGLDGAVRRGADRRLAAARWSPSSARWAGRASCG